MTTRRREQSAWIVAEDEFHPNLSIAAAAADQQARLSSRKHVKDLITKLENQSMKTAYELAELCRARLHLADLEQRIKDFDPPTDGEN